jgi:hypothetical protein
MEMSLNWAYIHFQVLCLFTFHEKFAGESMMALIFKVHFTTKKNQELYNIVLAQQ